MKPELQNIRCYCCLDRLEPQSMFFAYDKAFCSPRCRNKYINTYHGKATERNLVSEFKKIRIVSDL